MKSRKFEVSLYIILFLSFIISLGVLIFLDCFYGGMFFIQYGFFYVPIIISILLGLIYLILTFLNYSKKYRTRLLTRNVILYLSTIFALLIPLGINMTSISSLWGLIQGVSFSAMGAIAIGSFFILFNVIHNDLVRKIIRYVSFSIILGFSLFFLIYGIIGASGIINEWFWLMQILLGLGMLSNVVPTLLLTNKPRYS